MTIQCLFRQLARPGRRTREIYRYRHLEIAIGQRQGLLCGSWRWTNLSAYEVGSAAAAIDFGVGKTRAIWDFRVPKNGAGISTAYLEALVRRTIAERDCDRGGRQP